MIIFQALATHHKRYSAHRVPTPWRKKCCRSYCCDEVPAKTFSMGSRSSARSHQWSHCTSRERWLLRQV